MGGTQMESKAAARKRMGGLRRSVGPEQYEALVAELKRRLAGVRYMLTLGCYRPIGSEPDLTSVFVAWREAEGNRALALPWCTSREPAVMDFRVWTPGETLLPDATGIPAPSGEIVVPDALIIPCLGWTRSRRRLGYGGGFFDRYVARVSELGARPRLIGVGYGVNEVEDGLFETHDLPLDLIITDIGVF